MGTESVALIEEEYRFNRTLDYDYDVENFLQEICTCSRDERPIDRQMPHLLNAMAIYKGPYLPKMDYDWVLIQRENLHQKYVTTALKSDTLIN